MKELKVTIDKYKVQSIKKVHDKLLKKNRLQRGAYFISVKPGADVRNPFLQ